MRPLSTPGLESLEESAAVEGEVDLITNCHNINPDQFDMRTATGSAGDIISHSIYEWVTFTFLLLLLCLNSGQVLGSTSENTWRQIILLPGLGAKCKSPRVFWRSTGTNVLHGPIPASCSAPIDLHLELSELIQFSLFIHVSSAINVKWSQLKVYIPCRLTLCSGDSSNSVRWFFANHSSNSPPNLSHSTTTVLRLFIAAAVDDDIVLVADGNRPLRHQSPVQLSFIGRSRRGVEIYGSCLRYRVLTVIMTHPRSKNSTRPFAI